MDVLQFLINNWDSVLVVLAFIAIVVVLIKRGETRILEQILFGLVTRAEKELGGGTGKLKYATVADLIYQRIPAVLKVLFTSKDIEKMINKVLEDAKTKWSNNPKLIEATTADMKNAVSAIAESAIKAVAENAAANATK